MAGSSEGGGDAKRASGDENEAANPSNHSVAKRKKREARAALDEKKAAKNAAKNEAKAGRVAKWKQNRKLEDKAAKAASHPNKVAKRKARLLVLAEKLEAEAKTLLAQAKDAREKYTQIAQSTEKEGAKSKVQSTNSQKDESADSDVESDGDSSSDDGGAKVESTPAKVTPVEKVTISQEEDVVMKDKKKKKTRKSAIETPEDSADEAEEPKVQEQLAQKDKAKKKKKRKLEAQADDGAKTEDVASDKKKKKAKKAKKEKLEATTASEEKTPAANAPENWNVQSLDGGSDRKAKFLRLLGGKKAGQTMGDGDKPRDNLDMKHVADDLEKQFEAGRHMKFETGGQKRGLGA
ncbi:putative wound-responsive protein ked protein [Phaeoacremonium minimum UCRPA7]|uniref:Small acidic protein n=1 Tax=Phaeoacremonium minimum (strain UCR-PA7) TaxID=1286976 RepID=R8BU89_PHAM7|nr:putative wound-responsive protein ked protein [Phaeoacremonium minimum UCRPA7]EOO02931.1 putative wound-responsive protein ked protein [Phaeoacremonium minimum UCRPA7]